MDAKYKQFLLLETILHYGLLQPGSRKRAVSYADTSHFDFFKPYYATDKHSQEAGNEQFPTLHMCHFDFFKPYYATDNYSQEAGNEHVSYAKYEPFQLLQTILCYTDNHSHKAGNEQFPMVKRSNFDFFKAYYATGKQKPPQPGNQRLVG